MSFHLKMHTTKLKKFANYPKVEKLIFFLKNKVILPSLSLHLLLSSVFSTLPDLCCSASYDHANQSNFVFFGINALSLFCLVACHISLSLLLDTMLPFGLLVELRPLVSEIVGFNFLFGWRVKWLWSTWAP